ncbi:MAG: DNA polymerase sliding clamp [Desulfurococcales archaeon]|nr:DNA polymerase sliding clamp [Desulfurococcales archaeon]MEB3779245.1 DNA polymerase sliding clamp [Desulfurococcales archaeon]
MISTLESEITGVQARIKYPDAKTFKTIVDSLSKILDEAKFELTSEGLKVVGMDPAKVALIEVNIPYDSFLEYEILSDEGRVEMGLNMDALNDMLKRGKKGDPISFMVSADKVLLVIESTAIKRYLVHNLEVVLEVPEEVKLEHDVEAVVIGDVLKKALKDAEVVGDLIEFEADEDKLVLRARGEGRSRVETRLTRDTAALIDLNVRNPATSAYDIGYIKNVINLTGVAEAVEIKFSSSKPLELVFKSPDGSRVRYLLAPSA